MSLDDYKIQINDERIRIAKNQVTNKNWFYLKLLKWKGQYNWNSMSKTIGFIGFKTMCKGEFIALYSFLIKNKSENEWIKFSTWKTRNRITK